MKAKIIVALYIRVKQEQQEYVESQRWIFIPQPTFINYLSEHSVWSKTTPNNPFPLPAHSSINKYTDHNGQGISRLYHGVSLKIKPFHSCNVYHSKLPNCIAYTQTAVYFCLWSQILLARWTGGLDEFNGRNSSGLG